MGGIGRKKKKKIEASRQMQGHGPLELTLTMLISLASRFSAGFKYVFLEASRQWTSNDVSHHVQIDRIEHDGDLWWN